MKKILSCIIAFALALNVFSFAALSANSITINNATLQNNTNKAVNISGNTTSSKEVIFDVKMDKVDTLIKIEDKDGNIVYIEAVLAKDNMGEHKFTLSTNTFVKKEKYTITVADSEGGISESFVVENGYVPSNAGGGGETKTETTKLDDASLGGENKKLLETAATAQNLATANIAIAAMSKGVTNEVKKRSDTSENAALVTGIMAGNISAKSVKTKTNKLEITESLISASDLNKVENTVTAIMNSIKQNGYEYNREIQRELVIKVSFDKSKKATIVISPAVIDVLKGIDVLTIADNDFRISFTVEDLKMELAEMEEGENFEIYFEKVVVETENEIVADAGFDFLSPDDYRYLALATKTTANKLSFNKSKLAGNANVSVPAASKSNTQFQTVKKVDDNTVIGGKYNAATGMVDTTIGAGGTYIVQENQVDFSDIANKSAEMQEAIRVLASKGIIEGTGNSKFSPDSAISRAELAKLLVKTLYANGGGAGFTDTAGKWYESYAKAAKGAGIINGYEDGSFRGDNTILKEQIIAISARTLREKKKYYNPTDVEKYLAQFSDRTNISAWANIDIALAARENLIIKRTDGRFNGGQGMTRGEAALVLKRLFDRL